MLYKKTNFWCCFIDFTKAFDIVSKTNHWNILKELKVHLELRVLAIGLYENAIVEFRNIEGYWLEEINCNIWVKKCCPLYPIFFGIYIKKLEGCLEGESFVSTTLASIASSFILMLKILFLRCTVLMILTSKYNFSKDFSLVQV